MRPGKIKLTLLIMLLVCLPGATPASAVTDEITSKKILYINSYHDGYVWSQEIRAGLEGELLSGKHVIELQLEDLDTQRFRYKEIAPMLYELFKKKFCNQHFDLIVVSDNPALAFMLQYGKKVFPSTPIVFCGLNIATEATFPEENITGVIEHLDLASNIRLALAIQPSLKHMVVIGDKSITGSVVYAQMQEILPEFKDRLTFEMLSAELLPNLLDRVKAQDPQTTAFYFFPIHMEHNGHFYSAQQMLEILHKQTNAKFYSNWHFLLGHGLIGGKVLSGRTHGEVAAQMALRVLGGEKISDIPIERGYIDSYVFDYNELQRHGVNMAELPTGSSFIGMPAKHYSFNKDTVWIIVAFLLVFITGLSWLLLRALNRRRIEARGKEQLSFLRLLMDTVPIPIYSEDMNGHISECNVAFEKYFGHSREQILNRSGVGNIMAMRALDDAAQKIKASPTNQGSQELTLFDGNGNEHLAVLHHSAYVSHRGEPIGFVGAIIDYTEREKSARELSASQAMLKLVLDNIPQFVYWKDINHIVMGSNRAFNEFFNISNNEVIGSRAYDFFGERLEPSAKVLAMSSADDGLMVSGKRSPNIRAKFTHKGKTIIVDTRRIPLFDVDGKPLGVLVTAEDISDHLLLQQQLIQSQKMEAIGTLAGGIAHDFNNILTSIINSIELVLDDIDDQTTSYEDLVRALRAANQGGRLVRQILSFSRSSVEGFVISDIKEAVNDAMYMMKASLPRNIQLWKNIANRSMFMRADPIQIHQVVLNLCTNSSHALQDSGGVIGVSLAHTHVTAQQAADMEIEEGEYAIFSVEDNGPGISQENIGKIFMPFFTTKREGTGLGLPVVHGIVKAHKGAIQVSSTPWQKTIFNVFLPLEAHNGEQPEADPTMVSPPARKKAHRLQEPHIIFVEDDESQLYIVPKAMQGLGYKVSTFMSGEKALKEICANPEGIAAVVSDFDMPHLNGFELARALLKCVPDLPVIIVSGRAITQEKADEFPNIREIIQKPYNRDMLDQALRRLGV